MEKLIEFNKVIPIHYLISAVTTVLVLLVGFFFRIWFHQQRLEGEIKANFEKDEERNHNFSQKLSKIAKKHDDLEMKLDLQNAMLIEIKTLVNLLVENRIKTEA